MARHDPVWVVREVVLNPCVLIPLGHRPEHHDYTLTDSCSIAWRGYEAYNRCADYTAYRNTVKAPVVKLVKARNAQRHICTCDDHRPQLRSTVRVWEDEDGGLVPPGGSGG